MSPSMVAVYVAAAFFVGRLYGIVVGQRRREERIERQRGTEVKHLLDYIRSVWR